MMTMMTPSALLLRRAWHLDEVYLRIGGRMAYLWGAVDAEGEVLDVVVQSRRNKHAALNNAQASEEIRLRSRSDDQGRLGLICHRRPRPWDGAAP
jgi:hypothetical protein